MLDLLAFLASDKFQCRSPSHYANLGLNWFRFREMSDEELAGVLEQLLHASKSFPSSVEDQAVDGKVELDQRLQEDSERGSTVTRTWSGRQENEGTRLKSTVEESLEATHTKVKSGLNGPLSLQGKASAGQKGGADLSSIPQNEKRRIVEDITGAAEQKADGRESRPEKESNDERDLAALLWEELQKRSEASSGAVQRSVETKMKSDIWDRMNFGPRTGAFRDPKIVAAIVGGLVANGLLIVGGWSFLASRNRDRPSKQDEVLMEASGNDSETSQGNPVKSIKILDQGAAFFKSILRGSPNAGGQKTSMGKRKGLQPGESTNILDSAENKQTVGTTLSSGSQDGQQLSSRGGISRPDILEGKGGQAAVLSSPMKRGGSQFTDDINVLNKANLEPAIRGSNSEPSAEMELGNDIDMSPRIKSYRRNTDLEDSGYRYATGRLASPFVDAIIPGDRSWSDRSPLTALKNEGKNSRTRELASNIKPSVETSTATTQDNFYSSQQRQGPSIYYNKDQAQMARNKSYDAPMNPTQVSDNRTLQSMDDQVTTISDTVQYSEVKSDEKFTSRIGSKQDANETQKVRVDFWAKTNEDVLNGRAHNSSRQVDTTIEGERDSNKEEAEIRQDWFNHNGSLWVRDSDGVYLQQPTEMDSQISKSLGQHINSRSVQIHKAQKGTGSDSVNNIEIMDLKSTSEDDACTRKDRSTNGSVFDYRLLRLHQGDDNDRSEMPRRAQRKNNVNVVSFSEKQRPSSPIERTSPLYYGTREQGHQQNKSD
jgi:hypothetical protein